MMRTALIDGLICFGRSEQYDDDDVICQLFNFSIFCFYVRDCALGGRTSEKKNTEIIEPPILCYLLRSPRAAYTCFEFVSYERPVATYRLKKKLK